MAGARLTADGRGLADTARIIRQGDVRLGLGPTNTTIGVVATDAALTKPEAARLAALAHGGLTAALSPAHLAVDGDTLFALATGPAGGARPALDALGLAGGDAVAEAIVRAVRAATSLAGSPPSWRELFGAHAG
jgi:L-aminopeptidase/D-esterase-like protein